MQPLRAMKTAKTTVMTANMTATRSKTDRIKRMRNFAEGGAEAVAGVVDVDGGDDCEEVLRFKC
jgi:hypothetical protein